MKRGINLHIYEGNGVPIQKRNCDLPDYQSFAGPENPENYIAATGLRNAVNVALALGQPLLITGEPGTGKTRLAASIAHELGPLPLLPFYTKTTSTAVDLFYQYDALRRFQDTQMKERKPIDEYISFQALGKAILLTLLPEEANPYLSENLKDRGPIRSVVLIDEIDKAPRDLPNDVLNEIEDMEFAVKETGRSFKAQERYRPILVLTSNSEKNLPDAFLRRCVFYHIEFPTREQLRAIVQKRFSTDKGFAPEFTREFIDAALEHFYDIRALDLKKKPANAEFLAWISVIKSLGVEIQALSPESAEKLGMSYSILAKNREDLNAMKKFLSQKTQV